MKFETKHLWEAKIPIIPMPKQSAKFANGRAFTPAKVKKYVNMVIDMFELTKPALPKEGCFELEICFCYSFNKKEKKKDRARGWRFKNTQPDIDNLNKPIMDAMQNVIIKHDGMVARGIQTKIHRDSPYVLVILRELIEI